jgi:hypothetical protein
MAARRDPIREWREQYARTCLHVDFQPVEGSSFHASARPVAQDLPVLRVDLSPGSLFRDEELARDGEDVIGFFIAQSQDLHFSHIARELRLHRGDATMMRADTTSAVASGKDYGFSLVLVRLADLEARIAHPHDGLMRRVPRNSEALQLLRGYLRALETSRFNGSADSRELVRGAPHRSCLAGLDAAANR